MNYFVNYIIIIISIKIIIFKLIIFFSDRLKIMSKSKTWLGWPVGTLNKKINKGYPISKYSILLGVARVAQHLLATIRLYM